jgi:hypothetical protein
MLILLSLGRNTLAHVSPLKPTVIVPNRQAGSAVGRRRGVPVARL